MSLMKAEIRFSTSFSQSFAKKDRKLIGRYEEEMPDGFPGIKIKIIIEISIVEENKKVLKQNSIYE